MKVKKVISGGQIGVDIAALHAAKACGIETGGYAPKGFKTKEGPNPALADYGLIEMSTDKYPPRTFANVEHSDATLLITYSLTTPGSRCTVKAVRKFKRSAFGVHVIKTPQGYQFSTEIPELVKWLTDIKCETLNVAGNSDAALEDAVESYLTDLFKALQTGESSA